MRVLHLAVLSLAIREASGLRLGSARRWVSNHGRACAAAALCVLAPAVVAPTGAQAFENRVGEFKGPKTPGPAPAKSGLDADGLLKACLRPAPNCFSTTPLEDPNTGDIETVHLLSPWSFDPKALAPEKAYAAIETVLKGYEPGQQNIDGGGFEIKKMGVDKNMGGWYANVVFESFRRGFRDDVEIFAKDDGSMQVFTSSRVGYLDFGVNAKRLNYIAGKLEAAGFTAPQISAKTHPIYWQENQMN